MLNACLYNNAFKKTFMPRLCQNTALLESMILEKGRSIYSDKIKAARSERLSRVFKKKKSHLVPGKRGAAGAGAGTAGAAPPSPAPGGTRGAAAAAARGDGACNGAARGEEEEGAWRGGIQPSGATPPPSEPRSLPPPVERRI